VPEASCHAGVYRSVDISKEKKSLEGAGGIFNWFLPGRLLVGGKDTITWPKQG